MIIKLVKQVTVETNTSLILSSFCSKFLITYYGLNNKTMYIKMSFLSSVLKAKFQKKKENCSSLPINIPKIETFLKY